VYASLDQGTIYSLNHTAKKLTTRPRRSPGAAILQKLTPHDFIAVISLELDNLPNARSVPSSMDIGKVQITAPGRLRTKIFMQELSEAPYSVIYCAIRNSVPDPTNTVVNAAIPNRKVKNTSRKI
jgi:hypothetical protein